MLSDQRRTATFDFSAGVAVTIAAPGDGKHLEIDHIEFLPSGGANTLTFSGLDDGAGISLTLVYPLDDNQGFAYDNVNNNGNTFTCLNNTALTITPSAATRVTGAILYRIV